MSGAVDVAVIGAGPWGLATAWRAAVGGARVALVDDGGEPTAAVAAG
ncbi:MAG: dependent oxidoreductase, partial [Miltoncostaeaceae bacterium]|nr:dependent oxidoreductase [Miltoncostaeaceae bacterium]